MMIESDLSQEVTHDDFVQTAASAEADKTKDDDDDSSLCSERTLWTRLWQGMAGASVVVNLAAMAMEGPTIMIIAGLVALFVGPVVILRAFQLQNMDSK